jgi:hypothetical protein
LPRRRKRALKNLLQAGYLRESSLKREIQN